MRSSTLAIVLMVAALVPFVFGARAEADGDKQASSAEAKAEVQAAKSDGAQTPGQHAEERIQSIRRNEYFYQSFGRQDPFRALVTGEFEESPVGDLVDVNTAKLVGVMWGAKDKTALLEDGTGNGFIVRVGDPVRNGRVVAINESSVVASVTLYGITSRVILRLEKREG